MVVRILVWPKLQKDSSTRKNNESIDDCSLTYSLEENGGMNPIYLKTFFKKLTHCKLHPIPNNR